MVSNRKIKERKAEKAARRNDDNFYRMIANAQIVDKSPWACQVTDQKKK